jgi:lysophospholipase L1-like esterase
MELKAGIGRLRRGLGGLLLAVVSLGLCLLAVEFGGRLLGLFSRPSRQYQFSATKGYELWPGHPEVNSHGMRDVEHAVLKPPGTFRIVVLGDSFTFGDGVAPGDAYPKQLERLLNGGAAGGAAYEVLNAGVPGYSTAIEAIHLEELGLRFDPDLVLLGFMLNDAEAGGQNLEDSGGAGALARVKDWVKANFGLYHFLRARLKRLEASVATAANGDGNGAPGRIGGASVEPLRLAARGEPSPGWDACRGGLQRIARLAGERGIPVVVLIFPYLVNLDDGYPLKEEHAVVARAAGEAGMQALDLLEAFTGIDPPTIWVSETDSHPNARGHELIAAAVHRYLASSGLLRSGEQDGMAGEPAAR